MWTFDWNNFSFFIIFLLKIRFLRSYLPILVIYFRILRKEQVLKTDSYFTIYVK